MPIAAIVHHHLPLSFLLIIIGTFLPSPLHASNGIRQRNSSVPLRQVVEKSRSQSSSLILFATNVSSPSSSLAMPAPAGRHAVIAGFDHHHNYAGPGHACPHCDPTKCAAAAPGNGQGAFCVQSRQTADDSRMLWQRCLASAKDLDKLLRRKALLPASGGEWSGCRQTEGREQGNERICWCQAGSSSLLKESKERGRMHARRRKNHHSHQMEGQNEGQGTAATLARNAAKGANGGGGKGMASVLMMGLLLVGATLGVECRGRWIR